MNKAEVEYVLFKGIKINNVGLRHITGLIKDNVDRKEYVCVNDVRNIMWALKDKKLSDAINESLLTVSDGTPLAWYGRLLGCKRIQRVQGVELMAKMLEDNNGIKHYLLGDTDQTISRVIAKARKANHNLQVAGHSPPFRELFSESDNDTIFEKIHREDPDIVWVSFGGGKQDIWMHQNIHKLRRGVLVGVGAAFKWYLEDLYMPPKFFRKLGMQWLFRLLMYHRELIPENIRYRSLFVYYFLIEVLKARKYST